MSNEISGGLLPCPFCGTSGNHISQCGSSYQVTCAGCALETGWRPSAEAVAAFWNTRISLPVAKEDFVPGRVYAPIILEDGDEALPELSDWKFESEVTEMLFSWLRENKIPVLGNPLERFWEYTPDDLEAALDELIARIPPDHVVDANKMVAAEADA